MVKKRPRNPRPAESQSVQRQIARRWTRRLANDGWTPVCDYFLRNYHRLKITHTEAMVIIHIMSFKWDSDAPFPALKTIAKRMGITAPSVRTHLRNLETRGLLRRQMNIGTTNRFHLQPLFDRLEELMDMDEEETTPESTRVSAAAGRGL